MITVTETLSVTELDLTPVGQLALAVAASEAARAALAYIYRVGNSTRWDANTDHLLHIPTTDLLLREKYRAIVRAAGGECGLAVQLAPDVRWRDVSPPDQADILAEAQQHAG